MPIHTFASIMATAFFRGFMLGCPDPNADDLGTYGNSEHYHPVVPIV
jgi:hypothetical protein